ncbi:hypothetical protein HNR30_002884 [Nonomuraea soli]|uniref:Uncharacterized protein n=1 Tax=Nonomuraea soli TaxID=1032476 RepID=A0A7W0CI51_9ACTN|nr:hypothetical protein [Nonomuraea soli]
MATTARLRSIDSSNRPAPRTPSPLCFYECSTRKGSTAARQPSGWS